MRDERIVCLPLHKPLCIHTHVHMPVDFTWKQFYLHCPQFYWLFGGTKQGCISYKCLLKDLILFPLKWAVLLLFSFLAQENSMIISRHMCASAVQKVEAVNHPSCSSEQEPVIFLAFRTLKCCNTFNYCSWDSAVLHITPFHHPGHSHLKILFSWIWEHLKALDTALLFFSMPWKNLGINLVLVPLQKPLKKQGLLMTETALW